MNIYPRILCGAPKTKGVVSDFDSPAKLLQKTNEARDTLAERFSKVDPQKFKQVRVVN